MYIDDVVEELLRVRTVAQPLPPHLGSGLDLEQAYEVQLRVLQRLVESGERQTGWKVGLTAETMRVQQGVNEPCLGYLLDSGHHESGKRYCTDQLVNPGFENELCLTLAKTLRGPGVTLDDVRDAVSHATPAIEIVEVRCAFAKRLPLAIADNAQHKAYVTGLPVALTPENDDLSGATLEVRINDMLHDRACGSAVMNGGGLLSVVWLANKLSSYGLALEAGSHVMSGSFTKQFSVSKGIDVDASFVPFGTVKTAFT